MVLVRWICLTLLPIFVLVSCKPRNDAAQTLTDKGGVSWKHKEDSEEYIKMIKSGIADTGEIKDITAAIPTYVSLHRQFNSVLTNIQEEVERGKNESLYRFWYRMFNSEKTDPWYQLWEGGITRLQHIVERMKKVGVPKELLSHY